MKSSFWRDYFLALALAISIPLSVAAFLEKPVPLSFWLTLAFISLLTIAIYRFLLQANAKRPQIFVASFMGSLTVKLFLSAMILVAVGVLDRPNLKFTAVSYFGAYVLYTVVEIKNLLHLIRTPNN